MRLEVWLIALAVWMDGWMDRWRDGWRVLWDGMIMMGYRVVRCSVVWCGQFREISGVSAKCFLSYIYTTITKINKDLQKRALARSLEHFYSTVET